MPPFAIGRTLRPGLSPVTVVRVYTSMRVSFLVFKLGYRFSVCLPYFASSEGQIALQYQLSGMIGLGNDPIIFNTSQNSLKSCLDPPITGNIEFHSAKSGVNIEKGLSFRERGSSQVEHHTAKSGVYAAAAENRV